MATAARPEDEIVKVSLAGSPAATAFQNTSWRNSLVPASVSTTEDQPAGAVMTIALPVCFTLTTASSTSPTAMLAGRLTVKLVPLPPPSVLVPTSVTAASAGALARASGRTSSQRHKAFIVLQFTPPAPPPVARGTPHGGSFVFLHPRRRAAVAN